MLSVTDFDSFTVGFLKATTTVRYLAESFRYWATKLPPRTDGRTVTRTGRSGRIGSNGTTRRVAPGWAPG